MPAGQCYNITLSDPEPRVPSPSDPFPVQSHVHAQAAAQVPAHAHGPDHGHAPHRHPAQPLPWSLLRMGLPARLGLALGLSAALWAMTLAVS